MTPGSVATLAARQAGDDVPDEVARLRAQVRDLDARLADRETKLGLLEESLDGTWDWNMLTGDYQSPRWKSMLGYEDQEIDDRVDEWKRLLVPDDVARARAAVDAHCDRGVPYHVVLRYRRKDGSVAFMIDRGTATKDDTGRWSRMVGTHTDVTDLMEAARRNSEEQGRQINRQLEETVATRTRALKESNDRLARESATLHAVLESLGCGVIVSDLGGQFSIFNTTAGSILGLGPADEPMTEWSERYELYQAQGERLVPTDELPLVRALRGEHVDGVTLLLRGPTVASDRWLSVTARPVVTDGERVGAVVVFNDTTASVCASREQAVLNHRLQRSNEELQSFAYVASHDLQEPLRMVASFTELLEQRLDGQLDEKTTKYMGYVVEGAQRMRQLINDLLKYSRVGSRGKSFSRIDSEALVDEVLMDLEMAVRDAGANVTRDPLPTVWGDEVQLRQLLQNLVANAIKFCSDTPPRIHIACIQQAGQSPKFSVRDNGIGIPREGRERVFTIFQRLHAREDYPGSGLGLAVAKKIVQRHGGEIWVESTEEPGTTISFTLSDTNLAAARRMRSPARVGIERS